MRWNRWSLVLSLTLTLAACGDKEAQQGDPPQTRTVYAYGAVAKSVHGNGDLQYWLFEPAAPKPASAPLVVFLHGFSFVNPKVYGAWIEHMVRRGNIVVYPRYQKNLFTSMDKLTSNAIEAVRRALRELARGGHVRPNVERSAIVGHSAGGVLAANVAALAVTKELPKPKAVMCVQPGTILSSLKHKEKIPALASRIKVPMEDYTRIPRDTLLLVAVGDIDDFVPKQDSKDIFYGTPQIPNRNKDYVIVRKDVHNGLALTPHHFSPCAPSNAYDSGDLPSPIEIKTRAIYGYTINALDYFGWWKLFDGLCEAAFYGKNKRYAFQQRFMGTWRNGTPVRTAIVTDTP